MFIFVADRDLSEHLMCFGGRVSQLLSTVNEQRRLGINLKRLFQKTSVTVLVELRGG